MTRKHQAYWWHCNNHYLPRDSRTQRGPAKVLFTWNLPLKSRPPLASCLAFPLIRSLNDPELCYSQITFEHLCSYLHHRFILKAASVSAQALSISSGWAVSALMDFWHMTGLHSKKYHLCPCAKSWSRRSHIVRDSGWVKSLLRWHILKCTCGWLYNYYIIDFMMIAFFRLLHKLLWGSLWGIKSRIKFPRIKTWSWRGMWSCRTLFSLKPHCSVLH